MYVREIDWPHIFLKFKILLKITFFVGGGATAEEKYKKEGFIIFKIFHL